MFSSEHDKIQFGCLFATFLVWTLTIIPLYVSRRAADGGFNHHTPRMQYNSLTASGLRILGAHVNTMEAFTLFAVGVFVNRAGAGSVVVADAVSIVFVVSRVIYVLTYMLNLYLIRTVIWFIGFVATFTLYVLPFCT
ncbi:hypothetical protein IWQ60_005019 [Tieghemiomyces parasiticus]|uniref:MAPEG family protein n=2 Tax=Tieghemiomyces parasiticus TaxID=78921 RepID=A0A9W8A727_9FUNG|nr:hypothetical protein IWQ60_005019 [Tieghemiomyces parasiticus]